MRLSGGFPWKIGEWLWMGRNSLSVDGGIHDILWNYWMTPDTHSRSSWDWINIPHCDYHLPGMGFEHPCITQTLTVHDLAPLLTIAILIVPLHAHHSLLSLWYFFGLLIMIGSAKSWVTSCAMTSEHLSSGIPRLQQPSKSSCHRGGEKGTTRPPNSRSTLHQLPQHLPAPQPALRLFRPVGSPFTSWRLISTMSMSSLLRDAGFQPQSLLSYTHIIGKTVGHVLTVVLSFVAMKG